MATFDSIKKDLKDRNLAPIYFLHGEEAYYSDALTELFEEYLPEADRPFNRFTLYAIEKSPDDVMDIARRYPMMADKLVVIVKEVQNVQGGGGKWVNKLAPYAKEPSPTTVLVIVARGEKLACKEFTEAVKKGGGQIAEFQKIKYDRDLQPLILDFVNQHSLKIDSKGVRMLADFIGTDLSRLYNEIEKLTLLLPQGGTITPEVIEKNIGVSKEYNSFELVKALARRDTPKAMTIIRYLNNNQKNNPWVLTLSNIFTLFSNAMVAFYTPGSDRDLMLALGKSNSYGLDDSRTCTKYYSATEVLKAIRLIRQVDTQGKGIGSRQNITDLMEDLVMRICLG